jgi:hypothetical protein
MSGKLARFGRRGRGLGQALTPGAQCRTSPTRVRYLLSSLLSGPSS